ncbi:MAG: cytochrome c [Bacteroidetes bacterium]|nr:cytochrome c [Bacteroidota bacterium]
MISVIIFSGIIIALSGGCASTETITAKSGAQLWGENCMRCHNSPSPADYSDAQWETIGMHMKLRANITTDEEKKIVEFLQSAN